MEKSVIESHLSSILEGSGIFRVDVKIDRNNRITVLLDRKEGISIDDCVRISRELESRLDRDREDFALEVSSPGLDAPFRVMEQYEKNLGKMIVVETEEGQTLRGKLLKMKSGGLVLELPPAKKSAGPEQRELRFDGIRSARPHIRF